MWMVSEVSHACFGFKAGITHIRLEQKIASSPYSFTPQKESFFCVTCSHVGVRWCHLFKLYNSYCFVYYHIYA